MAPSGSPPQRMPGSYPVSRRGNVTPRPLPRVSYPQTPTLIVIGSTRINTTLDPQTVLANWPGPTYADSDSDEAQPRPRHVRPSTPIPPTIFQTLPSDHPGSRHTRLQFASPQLSNRNPNPLTLRPNASETDVSTQRYLPVPPPEIAPLPADMIPTTNLPSIARWRANEILNEAVHISHPGGIIHMAPDLVQLPIRRHGRNGSDSERTVAVPRQYIMASEAIAELPVIAEDDVVMEDEVVIESDFRETTEAWRGFGPRFQAEDGTPEQEHEEYQARISGLSTLEEEEEIYTAIQTALEATPFTDEHGDLAVIARIIYDSLEDVEETQNVQYSRLLLRTFTELMSGTWISRRYPDLPQNAYIYADTWSLEVLVMHFWLFWVDLDTEEYRPQRRYLLCMSHALMASQLPEYFSRIPPGVLADLESADPGAVASLRAGRSTTPVLEAFVNHQAGGQAPANDDPAGETPTPVEENDYLGDDELSNRHHAFLESLPDVGPATMAADTDSDSEMESWHDAPESPEPSNLEAVEDQAASLSRLREMLSDPGFSPYQDLYQRSPDRIDFFGSLTMRQYADVDPASTQVPGIRVLSPSEQGSYDEGMPNNPVPLPDAFDPQHAPPFFSRIIPLEVSTGFDSFAQYENPFTALGPAPDDIIPAVERSAPVEETAVTPATNEEPRRPSIVSTPTGLAFLPPPSRMVSPEMAQERIASTNQRGRPQRSRIVTTPNAQSRLPQPSRMVPPEVRRSPDQWLNRSGESQYTRMLNDRRGIANASPAPLFFTREPGIINNPRMPPSGARSRNVSPTRLDTSTVAPSGSGSPDQEEDLSRMVRFMPHGDGVNYPDTVAEDPTPSFTPRNVNELRERRDGHNKGEGSTSTVTPGLSGTSTQRPSAVQLVTPIQSTHMDPSTLQAALERLRKPDEGNVEEGSARDESPTYLMMGRDRGTPGGSGKRFEEKR